MNDERKESTDPLRRNLGTPTNQLMWEDSAKKRAALSRSEVQYELALCKIRLVALQRLLNLDIRYEYPEVLYGDKMMWEGSVLVALPENRSTPLKGADLTEMVWIDQIKFSGERKDEMPQLLCRFRRLWRVETKMGGKLEQRWRTQWASVKSLLIWDEDGHVCPWRDARYGKSERQGYKDWVVPYPTFSENVISNPETPFSEEIVERYLDSLLQTGEYARVIIEGVPAPLDSYAKSLRSRSKDREARKAFYDNLKAEIVEVLLDHPEGLSQKALAEKLGTPSHRLRKAVLEMVARERLIKGHENVRLPPPVPVEETLTRMEEDVLEDVLQSSRTAPATSLREIMWRTLLSPRDAQATIKSLEDKGLISTDGNIIRIV